MNCGSRQAHQFGLRIGVPSLRNPTGTSSGFQFQVASA